MCVHDIFKWHYQPQILHNHVIQMSIIIMLTTIFQERQNVFGSINLTTGYFNNLKSYNHFLLTDLWVPIFVEVINTGDGTAVFVWIIDMTQVSGGWARIAGYHCLRNKARKLSIQFLRVKVGNDIKNIVLVQDKLAQVYSLPGQCQRKCKIQPQ